jgi:hypothetical protein
LFYLKTKKGLNAISPVKAVQAVGANGTSLDRVHLVSVGAESAESLKMTAHFVHQLRERFCVSTTLLMVIKNHVRHLSMISACLVMSLHKQSPLIIVNFWPQTTMVFSKKIKKK